jgi:DNA-binding transcriptional LysR family regulator
MARDRITDVQAFLSVARERSFSRAAKKMGLSPSSLSHTIRALEESLGVRLLTRTTRSVSATEAGERLIESVGPKLDEVAAELDAVGEFSVKPKGTVRITATDHSVDAILWPRLSKVLNEHAELRVEVTVDYGLTDVVAERYDLGVRNGDQVEKDMVAVRIGPDRRMVIVATPEYLARVPRPKTPDDLLRHNCIALRFPSGGLYAWELKKGRREIQVKVQGQAVFNGSYQILNAALSGNGLAFVPEDMVTDHVAEGQLQYVMEDWFPTFPGPHVYYASGRQRSRAVQLVVDALRYPLP